MQTSAFCDGKTTTLPSVLVEVLIGMLRHMPHVCPDHLWCSLVYLPHLYMVRTLDFVCLRKGILLHNNDKPIVCATNSPPIY